MTIEDIMREAKTIAIVGMSDNPAKASHEVGMYLRDYYRIIPVNPNYQEIEGLTCYPDLESIPEPVDMVDVFQRSENVPEFVEPAINIGAKVFWMQLGIRNAAAAKRLTEAGLTVVEDRCSKIEHWRLLSVL